MTEEESTDPRDIAELERRTLRAETDPVEHDVVLSERRHLFDWRQSTRTSR